MSILKVAQYPQLISNFRSGFSYNSCFPIIIQSFLFHQMTSQTRFFEAQFQQKQSDSIKKTPIAILSQKYVSKRKNSYLSKASFQSSSDDDNRSSSSNSSNKNEEAPQARNAWTKKQELVMVCCFKEVGANWEEISFRLKTKLPFQIKSHFLRVLRGMVDGINNTLRQQKQKHIDFKNIKAAVEASDDYRGESFLKEGSLSVRECISNLIYTQLAVDQEHSQETVLEKIKQILNIVRAARRKKHGSKASTEIYMREEIQYEHFEEGYISDQSSFIEQPNESIEQPQSSKNIRGEFAEEEPLAEPAAYKSKGVIMQESQQGISDLLRESGVLEVEYRSPFDAEARIEYPGSPVNSTQHLNNEDYQHFYEEGELERDCYWKITPSRDSNND